MTGKRTAILTLLCAAALLGAGCGRGEESGAYQEGIEALEQQDYTTALAKFQEAAKGDGREAEAYRMEGITYLQMQDYSHAGTLLEMSLEAMEHKNSAFARDITYYLAEAYKGAGDTDRALELYTELIREGGEAQAYFQRGRLYLDRQMEAEAEDDFEHALKKDPGYDNYINVYLVYAEKNRKADGAAFLEEAVSREPENAEERYQQGRIYYYLEEYEKAADVLSQAADEVDGATLLLGKIYLETQDTDSARALYQKYQEKHSESAEAYNGLALCDIAEEKYDSALEQIQKGLEYAEDEMREALLFNEIVAYEKKLDFASAKEKMAVFLAEYPQNEEAARENQFLQNR